MMTRLAPTLVLALVAALAPSCSDDAAAQKGPGPVPPSAPGAAPAGAKGPPQKPLQVQVYPVKPEESLETVEASGELLANEQVEIVAELSRRLTAIHVKEGAQVREKEPLFELDRLDLEAQLARLRVQARYGRTALDRRDELAASGVVSKEERDAARQRVDEAGAAAKEVEVQIAKTHIEAPFAGVLGLRNVSVGAWVGPTKPLATLYDVSKLKVDFRVPERYASQVDTGEGQAFTFTVPGRPDKFAGRVVAIEPRIDPDTRSLVVRGIIDDPQGLLPGTFAQITLVLTSKEAIFVPAIAVQPSPTGTRLFVARDGKAVEVSVEVGRREPARVEIVKGLSEGDRVIVTNLLRVRNGAPVVEIDRGLEP
ncbi:MAG: efflux RND transporter periplasmic adaptor subunit [Deltaproteobacteria bacterium]|nr:efflux RND transporter periplasmic adaptor subunit [Deltaproteobacteria bacterium]